MPDDAQFVRYIDSLTNDTDAAIGATVRFGGNLGSDGSTAVLVDSSGDLTIDNTDHWFISDDGDGGQDDPVNGFIWGNATAVLQASDAGLDRDNVDFEFDVNVEPGETVRLMFFMAQHSDQASAESNIASIVNLSDAALAGIDAATQTEIANWDLLPEVDCADGLDDDGDGAVDCADPGCFAEAVCAVAVCPDDDRYAGNSSVEAAQSVVPGSYPNLIKCAGVAGNDYFEFEVCDGGTATVDLLFEHAVAGDLQMRLLDAAGVELQFSGTDTDNEQVIQINETGATATYQALISTAGLLSGVYEMVLTVEGCAD